MKRAGYWIIFVITCLLVAPSATSAYDEDLSRATLKGLRGVGVLVEKMAPEADWATLQTDVELKLRQAGIRVLSESGMPYLYLQVGILAPPTEGSAPYAYVINLSLDQKVVLKRNTAVTVSAPTWSPQGVLGTVESARLSTVVREYVRDQMDKFINAWLSVNPK